MKQLPFALIISVLFLSCATGNTKKDNRAEKQVSFALENKPHSYYVEQAKLWWEEIEKDSTSEENWYNYYRACRNAQGTADWREDFVEESPYLRLGNDIVDLMEQSIPNSFTYNYVKGSTGAVDPVNGQYLLKAYEMNPDFPGIQAAIVTYAVSTQNPGLRKEANKRWNNLDLMNPGLINYSQNLLKSLEPNAILLTQQDNDTYPAWMLQDVYGLNSNVLVLNIDFLLLKSYREKIFDELNVPPFQLNEVIVDDYKKNWKNVVQHLLANYDGDRPLYLGLTLSPEWYEGFVDQLTLCGLAYRFKAKDPNETEINKRLYEEVWNLDSVNMDHADYNGNHSVIEMNANYLKPLQLVFNYYLKSSEPSKAETVRQTAMEIAERTNNEQLIESTDSLFKSR